MSRTRGGSRRCGKVPPAPEAFFILRCTAPGCSAPNADLARRLGQAVAASRFGILVSTGCTLGALACRVRERAPVVAVQAANRHGQPVGPAVRIGPLRSADDVTALCDWVRTGTFDERALPPRLLSLQRGVAAAAHN